MFPVPNNYTQKPCHFKRTQFCSFICCIKIPFIFKPLMILSLFSDMRNRHCERHTQVPPVYQLSRADVWTAKSKTRRHNGK